LIIFNRIPKLSQLFPVYAVIALVIYTWTILWFFWKLPSWLDFLNMLEIGIVFSYVLTTNFVESLIVLIVLIVLCVILPRKWFLDLFVARGTALALLGLSYMVYLAYQVQAKVDHPTFSFRVVPIVLETLFVLVVGYVVGGIPPVRKALEFFADQATIFLYLSIPISVISVLIVLFRLTI
jgi:heme exporter protein D